MIDVKNEKLIRLSEVPALDWLPKAKGRKQAISVQSVYMWTTRGIRSIKLESLSMAGTRCTTEAAVLRFFEKLSLDTTPRTTPTPAELKRADLRARQVLAEAGI